MQLSAMADESIAAWLAFARPQNAVVRSVAFDEYPSKRSALRLVLVEFAHAATRHLGE